MKPNNIISTVLGSRKRLNYKNMLLSSICIFSALIGIGMNVHLVLGHSSLPIMWYIGAGTVVCARALSNIVKFNKEQRQVDQQLDCLIEFLKQNGIDVTKLKLQKAKVGIQMDITSSPTNEMVCITEGIVVFQDNNDRLRALKQVRQELIDYDTPKNNTIDGGHMEIIERPEEAEKLLAKIKR